MTVGWSFLFPEQKDSVGPYVLTESQPEISSEWVVLFHSDNDFPVINSIFDFDCSSLFEQEWQTNTSLMWRWEVESVCNPKQYNGESIVETSHINWKHHLKLQRTIISVGVFFFSFSFSNEKQIPTQCYCCTLIERTNIIILFNQNCNEQWAWWQCNRLRPSIFNYAKFNRPNQFCTLILKKKNIIELQRIGIECTSDEMNAKLSKSIKKHKWFVLCLDVQIKRHRNHWIYC